LLFKCVRFLKRLAGQDFVGDSSKVLAELIGDTDYLGIPKTQPLVADNFDLLETSAQVDPMSDIPADHQQALTDGAALFPDMNPGLAAVPNIRREDMHA